MFDADQVRLLMKAAVEYERHGTLPVDTQLALTDATCCETCGEDMVVAAVEEAL